MNYLILSSVVLAVLAGLVLVWRKVASSNRADRTAYYKMRSPDSRAEDGSRGIVSDGWWIVVVVTGFLLAASDE